MKTIPFHSSSSPHSVMCTCPKQYGSVTSCLKPRLTASQSRQHVTELLNHFYQDAGTNQYKLGHLAFLTRYTSICDSQSSPKVFSTAFTVGTETCAMNSPLSSHENHPRFLCWVYQSAAVVVTSVQTSSSNLFRNHLQQIWQVHREGRGKLQDNLTGWHFIFSNNKQDICNICRIWMSACTLSNRSGTSAPHRRERMRSTGEGGYASDQV